MNRRAPLRWLVPALLLSSACGSNELGFLRAQQTGDLTFGEPRWERFDEAIAARCQPDGAPPSEPTAFIRAPYLQRMDTGSSEVLFTSTHQDGFEGVLLVDGVELQRKDSTIEPGAVLGAGEQHRLRFEPGASSDIYCYRIERPGPAVVTRAGFRAPPPEGETVRFSALGDVGKASSDQLAVLEQLQRVVSDFVLVAGDVAYDDGEIEEHERHFFAVYAPMLASVPFYPALGNHDYRSEDGAAYFEVFSLFDNGTDQGFERWYSFDWGHVHVAVLDTTRDDSAQATWLASDLAASDSRYKIVVTHHPPWSSGDHGSHEPTRERYGPLFEAHGVSLVLSGHDHNYERVRPQAGVSYLVSGGGGRGTRPVGSSSFTAFSQRVAHFVHMEAGPQHMLVYAIDATGQVFDTARIDASP